MRPATHYDFNCTRKDTGQKKKAKRLSGLEYRQDHKAKYRHDHSAVSELWYCLHFAFVDCPFVCR